MRQPSQGYRRRHSLCVRAGVSAVLIAASTTKWTDALCATWTATPHAVFSAAYDTNARMRAEDERSSASEELSLDADLTRESESWRVNFAPQLRAVRYQSEPILDRNDVQAKLQTDFRRSTGEWGVVAQYIRDTTLTSELGLTGSAEVNRAHEAAMGALNGRWFASERLSIGANASWSAHQYDGEPQLTGLVNYDYGAAVLRSMFKASDRTQLSVELSSGRLFVPSRNSDSNQFHSDNHALNVELNIALGERTALVMSAGPTRVQALERSENGYGYSVSLSTRGERSSATLTASRDITPTSRGLLSKRDRAAGDVAWSITERVGCAASVQWARTEDVVPSLDLSLGKTRYTAASASLYFNLTPQWRTSLSATAVRQVGERAFAVNGSEANASRVALSITWNGLTHRR